MRHDADARDGKNHAPSKVWNKVTSKSKSRCSEKVFELPLTNSFSALEETEEGHWRGTSRLQADLEIVGEKEISRKSQPNQQPKTRMKTKHRIRIYTDSYGRGLSEHIKDTMQDPKSRHSSNGETGGKIRRGE
ncbi:Protein of unknown function [Gryllus bimaculatus]|nr:Protein of unknown function [Gryllus bimaculatus]